MLKLLIQTSSLTGTAAHHLPFLIKEESGIDIKIVYSENPIVKDVKYFKRKYKKIKKIGFLGAVNGMRMRNWYRLPPETNIVPVDVFCTKNSISYNKVKTLNSKDTVNLYKDFNPDLAVSLGNPYISSKIFSIPKYGMINIHHEILPEYQNAQSIIWQLYNGSSETGYTIHKISKRIDKGSILYQEVVPIIIKKKLRDTVIATNELLLKRSVSGLKKVLSNFDYYNNHAKIQETGKTYTTPSFREFLTIKKEHNKLYKQTTKS